MAGLKGNQNLKQLNDDLTFFNSELKQKCFEINICRNIPRQKKRDFLSYLHDLKYEQTVQNPDYYYQNVKVINFDIINHVSRGDPLENDYPEHYSIKRCDIKKYQGCKKKK